MESYQEIKIVRALLFSNSESSGFRARIKGHSDSLSEVQSHVIVSFIDLSLQSFLINASLYRLSIFTILTLLHLFELLVRSFQGLFLFSAHHLLEDGLWLAYIDFEDLELIISRKHHKKVSFLVIVALNRSMTALFFKTCRADKLHLADFRD